MRRTTASDSPKTPKRAESALPRSDRAPAVAILVDTSTGWGRRLVDGIHTYARKYGPWRLWIEPHGQHESLRLPHGWTGDGVIARVSTHAMARHLQDRHSCVVNVSAIQLNGVDLPRVTLDVEASAQLALEHFLDRGFRSFGYCGPQTLSYVENHRRSFENAVREAGYTCTTYRPPKRNQGERSWSMLLDDLGAWLRDAPKPIAVFSWGTERGLEIMEACARLGLDVPEDVAVLGGDDDDLLCPIATPPLSGITTPSQQIGYEAAALLDAMMHGQSPPDTPATIAPTGVATRQSTDTLAVDDRDVADAIRFIRENSTRPIQVADVLRHVPISRRSLERRFRQYLGRTPLDEIRHVRLMHATQLLIDTDLPVPEVAARSGFGTPQHLARMFRRHHDVSPVEFRKRARRIE